MAQKPPEASLVSEMNADFDSMLVAELTKRLKRSPSSTEVINAENDSDLVNEVMWKLVLSLAQRVSDLENNSI